ncbi:unnamed protein product [Bursaphelenchus xylophilus]|uniref:(pine wood nematode) hypothetical protein n=1 Tax=Bursaphelenchus xylophilus TaxID=6326 RepID=A0A1I7S9W6_BURXY|nr:unnamed protein product [Bursaphelenchus xylophilus]CAG9126245.1 unnamed protein product [Bursaphelenchus xylophilus]
MSGGYSGAGIVPQSGALYGSGYGERVLAPPEVQKQYQGKPAFFDSEHGVFFDGQFAYIYQAGEAGYRGEFSLEGEVQTGIERSIVLGNGTEGNLAEHAGALSSAYLLDKPIAVYEQ